jgi:hypothetical protein
MAYAAAAGAAGVGLLAAPQVAEAKIVYTPTNVSTGVGGSIPIDLNNDGTPDFLVFGRSCGFRGNCLFVDPLVLGNGIRGIDVAPPLESMAFPPDRRHHSCQTL